MLSFAQMALSDMHLGHAISKARDIRLWLRLTTADRITLVGDIIDGETLQALGQDSLDDPEHSQALGSILAKGRETRMTFIPGNHDLWLRPTLLGQNFAGVTIANNLRITDPQRRTIAITHGDEADTELEGGEKQGFWHSFGDRFIQQMQRTDRVFQQLPYGIRRAAGYRHDYSLAHDVKRLFANPILARMRTHHALKEKLDTSPDVDRCISGHTHMWGFFKTASGKLYMNSGSCTDHAQALVCDRTGLWAHLTMRQRGMAVLTEHGDSYFLTWKEMQMPEPSRLRLALDNSFKAAADLLVRHACGAESGKFGRPRKVFLDSPAPL